MNSKLDGGVGRRDVAGLLLVMIIAAARLIPTYTTFTATFDEPFHIAYGMEWLDKGTFTDLENPPLAHIALSLGPYFEIVKYPEATEGNSLY